MKKKLFSIYLCCCTTLLLAQNEAVTLHQIYFETARHELSPDSKASLDHLVQQAQSYVDYEVQIVAHTDSRGSESYNQTLAQARAQSVFDYLTQQKMAAIRIRSEAKGETAAGYDNNTAEGQQLNRRVDIELHYYWFDNLEQVFQRVAANNEQHFTIDPTHDRYIYAKNGTQFFIPANCFVTSDGKSPADKVNITVREALSVDNMLWENLHTQSDGQMLETGGMVYINASYNGEPLSVEANSSIEVAIPTSKKETDMQLFYGIRKADNTLDWQATQKSFTQNQRQQANAKTNLPPIKWTLKTASLPTVVKPTPPHYDRSLAQKPEAPSPPTQPFPPQKPQLKDVRYKPKFPRNLFMSKATIDAEKQNRYERLLQLYDKKMQNYQKQLADYEQKKVTHQKAVEQYKQNLKAWNADKDERLATYESFMHELNEYERVAILHTSLLAWQKEFPKYQQISLNTPQDVANLRYSMAYNLNKHCQKVSITTYNRESVRKVIFGKYNICELNSAKCKDTSNDLFENQYNDINKWFNENYGVVMDSIAQIVLERSLVSGTAKIEYINNYVSNITQLGWINCDRFFSYPDADKIMVSILESDPNVRLYLVATDLKSILPMYQNLNSYRVDRVPRQLSVNLVAVKLLNGKLQMATITTQANNLIGYKPQYKSCSLSDLKTVFRTMN
jgi:hypothetical protein